MARIVRNGPVEPSMANPVEAGRPQRPVEALPSSERRISS
jgi:hypothetical protein